MSQNASSPPCAATDSVTASTAAKTSSTRIEAMHAFIVHVWIARGLAETQAPPFSRMLERGLGVEEMIRTLEVPLFGIGLPLLLWLSFRRPF